MPTFEQLYSAEQLSTLSQQELVAIILQRQSDAAVLLSNKYDQFCRQIAENFPNGAVAILDHELNYLHVAGEAMHRHGFTEEMFIGRPFGDTQLGGGTNQLKEQLQQALQGARQITDITIGDQTYLISISPLLSKHGTVDQVLAVSQNITKQQNALRQVGKAKPSSAP